MILDMQMRGKALAIKVLGDRAPEICSKISYVLASIGKDYASKNIEPGISKLFGRSIQIRGFWTGDRRRKSNRGKVYEAYTLASGRFREHGQNARERLVHFWKRRFEQGAQQGVYKDGAISKTGVIPPRTTWLRRTSAFLDAKSRGGIVDRLLANYIAKIAAGKEI